MARRLHLDDSTFTRQLARLEANLSTGETSAPNPPASCALLKSANQD